MTGHRIERMRGCGCYIAQLDGRLFYAVLEGGETGRVVVLRYEA